MGLVLEPGPAAADHREASRSVAREHRKRDISFRASEVSALVELLSVGPRVGLYYLALVKDDSPEVLTHIRLRRVLRRIKLGAYFCLQARRSKRFFQSDS